MNRWVDRYIYGQFRTAASVAAKLRREGAEARVIHRQGNYIVQVRQEQPPWQPTRQASPN